MTYDKRAQFLIKRIFEAFERTSKPSPSDIVYAEGLKYPDVAELLDSLEGKEWHELAASAQAIKDHRNDEFEFLTTNAMRYFLPGYIVACLRNPAAADVLFNHIMNLLAPSHKRGIQRGCPVHDVEELLAPMTSVQIMAIGKFLLEEIESYSDEYKPKYESCKEFWVKKISSVSDSNLGGENPS